MKQVEPGPFGWLRARTVNLIVHLIVVMVRLYQRTLSPILGPCCRFTPSCSNYAMESVRKHGPLKGLVRALWRVCRCHPLAKAGYDPP